MKNKAILIILAFFLICFVSATQVCQVYDDFSSGNLDTNRWEIRQDVEGQPFTDEYWVDSILKNFHTQQNNIGDRRVYLVPKHTFTTGDIFEYDFNVISKEGNYMQMDLLTGDQYIRLGIMGYIGGVQGYDELGVSHIKIEFQENNLHLIRTSPSGLVLTDDLPLTNSNGNYELYIGSVFTNLAHMDFDNFELCTEVPEPSLEDRIIALEQKVTELENKVTLLETLVNKIKNYFWFMPTSIKEDILCSTLKETKQKVITDLGLKCEIKTVKKKDVCVCKKA